MIDEKKLIEILKERENLLHPHAFQHGTENGHIINDEQAFGRYSEIGIIRQTVKRLAEECNQKQIIQLAMMYAQNMVDYGIDVTQKWETATSQSAALNEAHMRGRQVERDKFAKWQEEHNGGWIPCSERLPEEDGEDVLVWFEYFRYGEYNGLYQRMGISYTFKGDWSGFVNGQSGWSQLRILAWMPLPPAFKQKGE